MGAFHFQVDRIHRVLQPMTLHDSLAPGAQTVALDAGQLLVYRGIVELAGRVNLVFEHEGQRLYTAQIDQARQCLTQDLEQLPHYAWAKQ